MVKFLKANWKILSIILLLSILYPGFILTYCPYAPLGRIPKDIGLQLVGYGGSILGGFLTLYGVWWTIKEQDRIRKEDQEKRDYERKEELTLAYRPILIHAVSNYDELNDSAYKELRQLYVYRLGEMDIRKKYFKIVISIANIGRAEATDVIISSVMLFDSKTNKIFDLTSGLGITHPLDEILKDSYIDLLFTIELSGELENTIKNITEQNYVVLNIVISYIDIFKNNSSRTFVTHIKGIEFIDRDDLICYKPRDTQCACINLSGITLPIELQSSEKKKTIKAEK